MMCAFIVTKRRIMFTFPLHELTEFNHALVYGFDPESSMERLGGSTDWRHKLLPESPQYGDLFRAYLYAQSTILPYIKNHGLAAVTVELLLDWIKTIHTKIAKSVLQMQGEQAGIYAQEEHVRVHCSFLFHQDLMVLLSSMPFRLQNKTIIQEVTTQLLQKHAIESKDCIELINLFHKVALYPDSILFPSQVAALEKDPRIRTEVNYAFKKLAAAFNKNKLSETEKALVNKIYKICMPIELIDGEMQDFAKQTLAQWQACDAGELEQVATLITETFSQFTDIHPFLNGNGRTATCFINIMLRSMMHPDILLREPGEKGRENSSYNHAIAMINTNIEPLKNHLKERMKLARTCPYQNEVLKQTVMETMEITDVMFDIMNVYPDYNLNQKLAELESYNRNIVKPLVNSREQWKMLMTSRCLGDFKAIKEQLDNQRNIRKKLSFQQTTGTPELTGAICAKLETLSSLQGWKAFSKGTIFLLENKDEEVVKIAIEKLSNLNCMHVTSMRHAITKIPVIKCTEIKSDLLMAISEVDALLACSSSS